MTRPSATTPTTSKSGSRTQRKPPRHRVIIRPQQVMRFIAPPRQGNSNTHARAFPGLDRMVNVPFTNLTRSSMLTNLDLFSLIVSRSKP